MATGIEKRLKANRVQRETSLVSKLNELLKLPIGIDSVEDADFLRTLALKQVEREQERKSGDGVYSPSGLASCLRRVYLGKNWKRLGLTRVELPAIEPHFYFLTGDFIHLKWQFVLWKLSQYDEDFILVDCEVPVTSKHRDHGGTIDIVCVNDGELQVVDVKGLNRRSFYSVDEGQSPFEYRIQVCDYIMLLNSQVKAGKFPIHPALKKMTGWDSFPRIRQGIILAENKGGPDHGHPAALTEHVVKLKDYLPEVRARLEILREHEKESTLPAIECVSRRGIQFQGCPFAGFCEEEVKQAEKKSRNAKGRHPKEYRVARPKRRGGAR